MNFFYLLSVFIFTNFFAYAQNTQIDSLRKILKNYEGKSNYALDTNYINIFNEFTLNHQSINPDSMVLLGELSVKLCQKNNYEKGLLEANRNIGIAYWVKSDYDQALNYYNNSLEIAIKLDNQKEVGRLYYSIAKVYDNQGKYPEALEIHFKALKISENTEDKKGEASCWNNIGNIYRNQSKYTEALESYNKSLNISKQTNNKKGVAYSMEGIANVYERQKIYDKSLEYYLISIKTEEELGDKRGIAYCLDGIANIYKRQKKYSEALENYQKGLVINRELGDKAGIIRILQGLGETYFALKEYNLAINYLKEGLEIAQKIGHKERIRNYNGVLSEVYEAMGQHTEALLHHKKFKLYADSLNNKETEKKTASLAAQYEYERKENLLKAEHERQNMQFRWIIIVGLVGLVAVLVIAFFVFRSRKRIQKAYEKVALANAEILQKNEEIEQQAENLSMANHEISLKNEQVEKAFNNIQIISEIGQKVTASLDLQRVIQLVYQSVNALMDATCFGIGIYTPKSQILVFDGFIEKNKVLSTITVKVNPDDLVLATICLLQQREILINNIYADAQEYGIELKPQGGDLATSLIYLPLIIENRTVGVITVQSFEPNKYGETELNILKALASYISIAIENSHNYGIIDKKNEHITSSIRYALTIQQAMLPNENTLKDTLHDYFVIYKPKDLVSGDFYWLSNKNDMFFVAVVDCTGHGVPGAFMSMISISLLHEAVNQQSIFEPTKILNHINNGIRHSLKQDETSNRDGMDLVLCKVEKLKENNLLNKITFVGAKRPLLYTETGKLKSIKGSRKSIGGNYYLNIDFEQQEIMLPAGEMLYLSTDGYADQANEKRENFGTMRLSNLLEEIATKPTEEQEKIILQTLHEHQQQTEQRDDISVLGFRL